MRWRWPVLILLGAVTTLLGLVLLGAVVALIAS